MTNLDIDLGAHPSNPKRGSVKVLKHKEVKQVVLFPVRYALGLDASKPPKLEGSFKVEGPPMPANTKAYYTLRRQRSGYLYIFHEKYQQWSCLKIDQTGVFSDLKAIQESGKQKTDPKDAFRSMLFTKNSLLLVEDDDPIWMTFANHPLSKLVLSKAQKDKNIRSAHMRFFDPKAWQGKPHFAPLSEAASKVADYADGISPAAFWHSCTSFKKRSQREIKPTNPGSATTIGNPSVENHLPTQAQWDKGAVVALDDPTGIVMDIRAMMASQIHKFNVEPARKRKNDCYQTVQALKSNFLSLGEKQYWDRYKPNKNLLNSLQENERGDIDAKYPRGIPVEVLQKHYAKWSSANKSWDSTIEAKVKQARADEWAPYEGKVNWNAWKEWPKTLQKEYDEQITPLVDRLAEAHAAWMQDQNLQKVFKYHYNSEAIDAHAHYSELLRLCIEGTQGWKACADLYKQWLNATEIKPGNLAMRALLNNDQRLLKAARDVKMPPTVGLDPGSMIEKIGIPTFAQGFSSLGGTVATRHKALAGELMGPLTELMGEALEKDSWKLSLTILAAVEGKGLKVVVYPNTSMQEVVGQLAQCVRDANPNLSSQASELAVMRMVSKYDPKNFGAIRPTKCVFAIDHGELAKVASTGTATGAILPMEEMINVRSSRFKSFKSAGGAYNVAALVCQTASLWYGIKSFKDAPLWNKTEEGARLIAGAAGYISAIGSTVIAIRNPATVMGLEGSIALKGFRWLGFAAAVGNGVVDAVKGIQAYKSDDFGEMFLYGGSVITGIASAWILTFGPATGWIPWVGWGLLIAYIGIQFFIANWSKMKIQSWLKHCSFGTNPGFYDATTEWTELNKAMGWA